jgi:hypothetical protein
LALLDVVVRLYPKGHEPRYDVTAAIPLDVPHSVNDLWTEIDDRPIRLDFSQSQARGDNNPATLFGRERRLAIPSPPPA